MSVTASTTEVKTMPANECALLRDLNENYVRAVRECDVAWFEANLDADFRNTNPDGRLLQRAEFLAQISKPPSVRNLACEQVEIRILDNLAIVHARTTYLLPDGSRGSGWYTDVWALRGGRWRCVAAHVNRA